MIQLVQLVNVALMWVEPNLLLPIKVTKIKCTNCIIKSNWKIFNKAQDYILSGSPVLLTRLVYPKDKKNLSFGNSVSRELNLVRKKYFNCQSTTWVQRPATNDTSPVQIKTVNRKVGFECIILEVNFQKIALVAWF